MLRDVPDDNACSVLDIGLLISSSQFLPLDLRYTTTPRNFLDLMVVLQGPGTIVDRFPLQSFYLLVFSAGQTVPWYRGADKSLARPE